MRVLAVLLVTLGIAAAAPAGLDLPPRSDAANPWWSDAHTIEYLYARDSVDHRPVAVDIRYGNSRAGTATRRDPGISPNGALRAYLDPQDDHLHLQSADGSNDRVLSKAADAYGDGVGDVAWSPDGTRIAFAAGGSTGWIDVIDVDGANEHRIHRGDEAAWISTDDVAVGLDGAATNIYAVSADGKHARLLVTGYYSPYGFAVSPDGAWIAFTSYLGWGYDRGAALYAAFTTGTDSDVRLVSPNICTVRESLTTTKGECLDGADWSAAIVGTRFGDIVVGGPGDDRIHAGDGQNVIQAQWGDDTILSGSGPDDVHAGDGRDVVRTGGGSDSVNPGPGRDAVFSGAGDDHIVANDGERDVIDCGPGADSVRVDAADVTRHCEHVTRAPVQLDQGY